MCQGFVKRDTSTRELLFAEIVRVAQLSVPAKNMWSTKKFQELREYLEELGEDAVDRMEGGRDASGALIEATSTQYDEDLLAEFLELNEAFEVVSRVAPQDECQPALQALRRARRKILRRMARPGIGELRCIFQAIVEAAFRNRRDVAEFGHHSQEAMDSLEALGGLWEKLRSLVTGIPAPAGGAEEGEGED